MASSSSLPIQWPEGAPTFNYQGGCHCKKIRFQFEHPEIYSMPALSCNCSMCASRGYIFVYTPQDKFKLTQGSEDEISQYTFASHIVQHRFCPTCGTAIGVLVPSYGYVGINARTVDGIDLERLQKNLTKVNGRELTLSTTEDGGELKPSVSWGNTGRQ
uniref:CENP-V/GFA domain-containing protein n=1 Tax=Mycena chlorophos TaxID=658473 RepID=A0ABQ0LIZ7_MYCCL|nr:predicted protein [Mycena chlorophos]